LRSVAHSPTSSKAGGFLHDGLFDQTLHALNRLLCRGTFGPISFCVGPATEISPPHLAARSMGCKISRLSCCTTTSYGAASMQSNMQHSDQPLMIASTWLKLPSRASRLLVNHIASNHRVVLTSPPDAQIIDRAACNNLTVSGGLGPRACCLTILIGHGTQGQRLYQFQFITQPVKESHKLPQQFTWSNYHQCSHSQVSF
jgi:hypothetical protein